MPLHAFPTAINYQRFKNSNKTNLIISWYPGCSCFKRRKLRQVATTIIPGIGSECLLTLYTLHTCLTLHFTRLLHLHTCQSWGWGPPSMGSGCFHLRCSKPARHPWNNPRLSAGGGFDYHGPMPRIRMYSFWTSIHSIQWNSAHMANNTEVAKVKHLKSLQA